MKIKYIVIILLLVGIIPTPFGIDSYFISEGDKKIKESAWVKDCEPKRDNEIIPSVGLYNHTHAFDLETCTWYPSDKDTSGFLDSLYIGLVEPVSGWISNLLFVQYAYAQCIEPLVGPSGPCFDSFGVSHEKLTEQSIMENFAHNIELNFDDWQISDRKWENHMEELEFPTIICTEFVANGVTEYRMAKWVDNYTISDFENHRDDSLCDLWLPPIDDGIKVTWDKKHYESDSVGIVTVIDKAMNLNNRAIDSFDIHVFSDIDHKGIQLRVTETEENSGIFKGTAYFTTNDESSGARLLVEDAVKAEHKQNRDSSRIINETTSEDLPMWDTGSEVVPIQTKTIGDDAPIPQFLPILILAFIGMAVIVFLVKRREDN